MTKEEKEAVLHCLRAMIDEELCEECPLYGTTGTDHCEKDCVRLAIEELEQEPCEETISKKAVLDVLAKYDNDMKSDVYNEIFDSIDKLPPVNPDKTGHWIDDGQYAEGHSEHVYRCSECGKTYIGYIGKYKECPDCGAKVDELTRRE